MKGKKNIVTDKKQLLDKSLSINNDYEDELNNTSSQDIGPIGGDINNVVSTSGDGDSIAPIGGDGKKKNKDSKL
ncbi:hypothetical protein [Photobacterium kasasachensis]|uniref:hypothetical protein n=1 Tax=Photobacterium kasasachensis TaxID=2910240 RepID=UPI003D137406